jgi:hypothetical protein
MEVLSGKYMENAAGNNVDIYGMRSTIPETIAVLLGIEHKTTLEWRVDGETRRVWVKVRK